MTSKKTTNAAEIIGALPNDRGPLEPTLSAEQLEELRGLAELCRTDPQAVRRKSWEAITTIYATRWRRPRMHPRTLKSAVVRINQGRKDS